MVKPAAYAAALLGRNPYSEADAIVAHRARIFDKQAVVAASADIDPEQLARDRNLVQRLLDDIRKDFWSTNLGELRNRLSDSRIQKVPDMAVAARRLLTLAQLRPEFPKLAQHKRCNGSLFNALKRVIVLSPREAGPSKDELLHQIKRSKNLKACKAMIKMMRQEFPELYRMEEEWLDVITSLKASKDPAAQPQHGYNSTGSGGDGIPWWVIWVGIAVLRVILRAMMQQ